MAKMMYKKEPSLIGTQWRPILNGWLVMTRMTLTPVVNLCQLLIDLGDKSEFEFTGSHLPSEIDF